MHAPAPSWRWQVRPAVVKSSLLLTGVLPRSPSPDGSRGSCRRRRPRPVASRGREATRSSLSTSRGAPRPRSRVARGHLRRAQMHSVPTAGDPADRGSDALTHCARRRSSATPSAAACTCGAARSASCREVIEEPARRAGFRLEPGLVELAIRDCGDRVSTLPHLSHALRETWHRREGLTLTVAGYEDAGGIAGGIAASRRNRCSSSLTPDQQELCRVASCADSSIEARTASPRAAACR